jgi:hypothetical protein
MGETMGRKISAKLLLGILVTIVGLSPEAKSQNCTYTEPALLIAQGSPITSIISVMPGALPDTTDQTTASIGTLENSSLPSDETIEAMTYDRRAEILYVATLNQIDDLSRIYALTLPLQGSSPILISVTSVVSTENIVDMTVDYTNSNRVYVLIRDQNATSYRIEQFPRLNAPVAQVLSPTFLGTGGAPFTIRFQGSLSNPDGSLIMAIEDGTHKVYQIPLEPGGVISNLPAPLDSDLFDSIPAGQRGVNGYEYDALGQALISHTIDDGTGFFVRHRLADLANPTRVPSAPFFASSQIPNPTSTCQYLSLHAIPRSSPANQEVFVRCIPFSPGPPRGLLTINDNLSSVKPILAITSTQVPSIGASVLSCCSNQADGDLDSDGTKDCADPNPLVFDGTPGNGMDADSDTIPDQIDECPTLFAPEADHFLVGLPLGCPCTDREDNDFDSLLNCQEAPADQNNPQGSQCTDTGDADRDQTLNCNDPCPLDPKKTAALLCGCEVEETPTCLNTCKGDVKDLGCGCGIDPCTNPDRNILTNFTVITTPPKISLGGKPGDPKRDVTITLIDFDAASNLSKKLVSASKASGAKLSVRYEISVSRIEGTKKKSVIRRTVRSNSVLLRKLSSGLYTAKYRALIKSKDKRTGSKEKTVAKTSFSPARTFSF